MTAQVFIAKESAPGELRVAATPETIKRYIKEGLQVVVQAGAGAGANIADTAFADAGANIAGDAKAAWSGADLVLKVQPPRQSELLGVHEASLFKAGSILITHMFPHKNLDAVKLLAEKKDSTLAMD
jgi:NAD(P) transhydrogenase subunit alpha